nr:M14 metal carboxypeptidase 13 [Antheraea yamamai]
MYRTGFILSLLFYFAAAKHEQYDGYALYEVEVNFLDEAKIFNDLKDKYNLDFWTQAVPGRPGRVLVPGHMREGFEDELLNIGIQFTVEVENIKEQLDLEDAMLASASVKSNRSTFGLSFDTIHRYGVVDQYMVDLANAYPNLVTVVSAGRSIEGRDIKYLKISTTNFQDRRKPVVMLQSLLHAREWVTLPATLYAIQKLVIDVTEQDLLQNIDWIILPIANPDGYEFTHTNDRFWRKNRARGFIIADICSGVDLNRNFDIFWGTASSSSVCSDTFHGRGPFSEPETAIIRDILAEYSSRIELYLDIHSFGSMILYGYGNGVLPPNALLVNFLGVRMAQAIDAVKWPQNRNYIVGNVVYILYEASGGAGDYAMGIGIPYSYTFELPAFRNIHNTVQGFLVDPDFIEQAGFETWEGIKVGARFVVDNFRRRNGQ